MNTSTTSTGSLLSAAYRPPLLGLLAFAGVILWKPVAHSISVLLSRNLDGGIEYLVGGLIGLLGAILVWSGLRKDEHVGTCLGFIGGVLIWLGWMEYAFEFFAHYMGIEMLRAPDGTPSIPPNLLVLQATGIPVLTILLLFLIANKDSRCRLALWVRKNLRLKAGTPTPGLRLSYSRITALEVIFVNWFMYLINITLNDSRIFGTAHPMQYAVLVAFSAWAAYMVFWRLTTLRDMPLAVRYSIGAAGPAWSAIEIASRLRLYKEVWIYPAEYPIAMVLITAAFLGAAWTIFRTPPLPRRPASPAAA